MGVGLGGHAHDMAVTLRVVGPNSQRLGDQAYKVFVSGGTIGRSAQNDWVLPDTERFISSHHAAIEDRGGECYLVDNSINGTFINSAEQPVGHGNSQRLLEGDLIKIGEYEISVSLTVEEFDSPGVWTADPTPAMGSGLIGSEQSVDPLDHFGTPPDSVGEFRSSQPVGPPRGSGPAEGFGNFQLPNAIQDPFQPQVSSQGEPAAPIENYSVPPPLTPAGSLDEGIPADWDRTTMPPSRDQRLAPTPAPQPSQPGFSQPPPPQDPGYAQQIPPDSRQIPEQPQVRVAPEQQQPSPSPQDHAGGYAPGRDQGGIAELLEAAGLDQATARAVATPENSHVLGTALRVVIQGLMEVLSARAELKNQFRVPMTQILPVENNPLKFCVDSTDALRRLLIQEGQGFLGPVDAFVESFEDIKAHQLAMMAGMRAAFDELMRRFDPHNLQKEFDHDLSRSPRFQTKAKYWDMLTELYTELNRDSDANFGQLFGDEFARAYEAQMDQLSGQRRS